MQIAAENVRRIPNESLLVISLWAQLSVSRHDLLRDAYAKCPFGV